MQAIFNKTVNNFVIDKIREKIRNHMISTVTAPFESVKLWFLSFIFKNRYFIDDFIDGFIELFIELFFFLLLVCEHIYTIYLGGKYIYIIYIMKK